MANNLCGVGPEFIAKLAAVPASVPRNVMLAWLANDPQTQLLAAQFGEILRRAGWMVVAARARTYTSPAPLFEYSCKDRQTKLYRL
jgi:hypothetical protein